MIAAEEKRKKAADEVETKKKMEAETKHIDWTEKNKKEKEIAREAEKAKGGAKKQNDEKK